MSLILKSDLTEAMIDAIAGLICSMDTGEILYASRLAEEMFGYKVRGELIGSCVDRLVPENVRDKHVQHRADYSHSPDPRPMGVGLLVNGVRKDSSLFPVTVSLSGVVLSGQRCVVVVIQDMTDKRNVKPTLS